MVRLTRTRIAIRAAIVIDHATHTGTTPGIVLRREADGSVG
jgi:hypothetical protein